MIIRSGPRDLTTIWTPAKLNLHLEVIGKRHDGYHELETVMVSIDLQDTIIIRPTNDTDIALTTNDKTVPLGGDNLVVRAAELLGRESGVQRGASIWLHKRIPSQAGLGGGSSDAAAVLCGLNLQWGLNWDRTRLAELGAEVGSDVPFFFYSPAAVARGRGERVESLEIGKRLEFVVVSASAGASTGEVFDGLDSKWGEQCVDKMCHALVSGDVNTIAESLFNRLHETAQRVCPAIEEVQIELRKAGVLGQGLTGSGSASFGLTRTRREAVAVARQLQRKFPGRVFVCRTTAQ